ncbi:WxL domain-containing protein [Ornithinibacillus halotolerans]|uniref:WxL domain-containing protein n=1 Tax=Ornithinibacillus halotolerans TaxID=1274357 RepID=A0A916SC95_9BACI|nr:WxL domain-containing protein [Ornithinibacillus halotolerans]GGA92906.1 hypothetical protein GCM10008025_39150 [Ornithinibacillus halotolerans]
MINFKSHEIVKNENDYVEIILYLDAGSNFLEEYSKEFGGKDNELQVHLAAQSYVKQNLPNTKFNKLKVMVGGIVVATMLGATLVAPAGNLASAAEINESNVSITGQPLAMDSLVVGTFNAVVLEGKIQSTTANIDSFNVTDPSGTGAGWNVTMHATQFTAVDDSGLTLPTGSLTVDKPSIAIATDAEGSSPVGDIITAGGAIDSGTGVKILSAPENSGMGTYTVSFDPTDALTLKLLPKDVRSGTYTSVITTEITTGP